MAKLDHIMYATPDLNQGIADIAELTGVVPAVGGSHPGNGTRNALLSLGTDQYLEIIAPDPEQDLAGTLGAELIRRGTSGIRAWAVAAENLAGVSDVARGQGLNPQPVIDMNRTTPAGVRLDWQLMLLPGDRLLPFFIDWRQSQHPALATPGGCTLIEFTVAAEDVSRYRQFLDALQIEVNVVAGAAGFSATLATPNGTVELSGW